MSFTNLTTKTELVKILQHFALNVKMYQNVISTQNVVNFLRHILPYLSFLMKDIITKKDSLSSLMSFTSQTTKTELIKKL